MGVDPAPLGADDRIDCRIGIVVPTGGDDLGRALFARIVRRELRRRLPAAAIRCFGLDGYANPRGLDGGEPLEPLGAWTPQRRAELAGEFDCVIVGGEDLLAGPLTGGLGADLEASCPVVWLGVRLPADPTAEQTALLRSTLGRSPYWSVRDEASKRRLEAAGVDQEVEVVADPAVLVVRHFDREVLDKRLEYLRLMGWYPANGEAVVVQGDAGIERFAPALAEAIGGIPEGAGDLPIVVAEIPAPADGEAFGDELSRAASERPYRIPAEVEVEDWIAATAASAGFIGTSPHGGMVAMAYGKPAVVLNLDRRLDGSGFDGTGTMPVVEEVEHVAGSFHRVDPPTAEAAAARQRDRLDRHLDRIAAIARAAWDRGGRSGRLVQADLEMETALLRTAHDVLSRRLAAERSVFADMAASFRPAIAGLEAQVARLEQQLRRLKSRRIYRYTTPLLSLYGSVRRWLGRGR